MVVKKLVVCGLLFGYSMYSVEENNFDKDDLSEEGMSVSTTKESNSENKNNWNTRKWGSIYFLFPHINGGNLLYWGNRREIRRGLLYFVLNSVVEYKYMFNRKFGINVKLNLFKNGPVVGRTNKKEDGLVFNPCHFDISVEWVYRRKGKKIFSGSFSPIGFGSILWKVSKFVKVNSTVEKEIEVLKYRDIWNWMTWGFILLKYEYNRLFYLNWGISRCVWTDFSILKSVYIWGPLVSGLLSIEFGFNIVGVNDWRKKKKINW